MSELKHHGILGMKWGVRRYQNPDGTLTPAGKLRYAKNVGSINKQVTAAYNNAPEDRYAAQQQYYRYADALSGNKMVKQVANKVRELEEQANFAIDDKYFKTPPYNVYDPISGKQITIKTDKQQAQHADDVFDWYVQQSRQCIMQFIGLNEERMLSDKPSGAAFDFVEHAVYNSVNRDHTNDYYERYLNR